MSTQPLPTSTATPPKRLKLSPFKVSLINKDLENRFKTKLFQDSRLKLLIFLIINLLLLITITIFFFQINQRTIALHLFIGFILIIQSLILIIAFLLHFLCSSSHFIQGISSMLNYILLSLLFINGRRILRHAFNIDALVYDWLFYIDILAKALWIILELSDYPYVLMANGIAFAIGKSLAIYYDQWPMKLGWNLLVSDLFLCIITAMSFITMKNARFLFSYINELTEQKKWYLDIVNNMNSGLITIKNDKIFFANSTIIDMFIKIGLFSDKKKENDEEQKKEIQVDSEEQGHCREQSDSTIEVNIDYMEKIQQESTLILKSLFKEVQFFNHLNANTSHEEDQTVLSFSNHETDQALRTMLFEKIKKIIQSFKSSNDKFIYIGRGKLCTEDNNTYQYEYYSRYYINEDGGENFELLLNNVTRTKLLEEKNAEIRLKSLVLSKIAHEFKNPLICMSEIIDNEKGSDAKQKQRNLTMIKSISNYLLVLVKNIDFFSQMQTVSGSTGTKKQNQMTISKCSIGEIIDFIAMITNYLLKKNKAEKKIKFTVIRKYYCDIIESDEIKLKQLLINLLSNSLKFTTKGEITLTITQEINDPTYITFSVKDTGIGIPVVLQQNNILFHSFSKAKRLMESNKYGTGLGLAISYELSLLLGKNLMYSSKEGSGSEFWFSVFIGANPTLQVNSKNSCASLQTLKNDDLVPLSLSMHLTDGERSSSIEIAESTMVSKKIITVLLADDEELIRQASKRLLKNYAIKHNLILEILEANDGIEMLWIYYDKTTKNEIIDVIISDENMHFYSGNRTAKEIKEIVANGGIEGPKFYLSSAYCKQMETLNDCIDGYFHKPLLTDDLDMIFNNFICE